MDYKNCYKSFILRCIFGYCKTRCDIAGILAQELVYPNNMSFSSPVEQEAYIGNWLEERVGFKADFKFSLYPGKFSRKAKHNTYWGQLNLYPPKKLILLS